LRAVRLDTPNVAASRSASGAMATTARALRSPWPGTAAIALVAFLARWPVIVGRVNPFGLQPDTIGYFGQAGHFFWSGAFTKGTPAEPGYPLFALIAGWLPGAHENNAAALQHVLGVGLAVATFVIAWRWLDRITAWAAGFLVATAPLLYATEDEALPDTVLCVLFTAFAVLLVATALRGADRTRWTRGAGLGALVGVAALVKPSGQVLVAAVPIALLAASWPWRQVLRVSAVAVATFVVVLSPWLVYNWRTFGQPTISDQSGLTLFNRMFEVDARPIPKVGIAGWIAAGEQNRLVAQQTGERLHAAVASKLQTDLHMTRVQAIRTMRHLALVAIRQYPASYAWRTVEGTRRYLLEAKFNRAWTTAIQPRAGTHSLAVPKALWRTFDRLAPVWWTLSLAGFAAFFGLVLGPRRRRVVVSTLLAVWGVVALSTVAMHGGLPRYSAQLLPLTFLLTVAGATVGARAVLHGARATRSEPPARAAPAPAP
jgi:4-amino-4-deoxy-L-arabinose transferase-like glycosyltransferase